MEAHLDSDDDANAHEKEKTRNERLSPDGKSRNKSGSVLKLEKHERAYSDFHPQILMTVDGKFPKSKGFVPKQQIDKNAVKSKELVMFMSNLPNYLERGENSREKTFNVGVLDWRLLKKWQHNQNDMSHRDNHDSHFREDISAFMSSEGSTSHSSSSHCFTPSRPRPESKTPAIERCFNGNPLPRNEKGFQDCKNSPINGLKESKNKELQREPETRAQHFENGSVAFNSKGNDIIHHSVKKNLEKETSSPVRRRLAENECCQLKMGISESVKPRNPSPTRRLNFGVAKIAESPSSKIPSACACAVDCTCDVSNATSRSRTSPLRRLLDPFLRRKGGENSCHSARSKDLSGTGESAKLVGGIRGSPASHSLNGVSGSTNNEKDESTLQALLQVAVKNGVPLYTFTVDNCSDILASTVKESYSPKRKDKRIYSFFSFSETRKKNGSWIYRGSTARNTEYKPNIIAQMKVSNVANPDSSRQNSVIESSGREFVLSSVGPKFVDQTLGSSPRDELAAIVIKFNEKIGEPMHQDGQLCGMKEPFLKATNCSYNADDEPNKSTSDYSFNATVILPGGDHGVPSKGEPSPLIKRWKFGGSCDCGGWDLGCRLRILTNGRPVSKGLTPAKSRLTSGQFKLFFEEESGAKRPFFVLSPFKDGIFSVQFHSSIKVIQAFSISIAILSSGKASEDITFPEKNEPKTSNQAVPEVSAKFLSYPPVSPCGRV